MDQVAAGSPGDDRECVKCGEVKRAASWDQLEECPGCGVIFAKAKARAPVRPAAPQKSQDSWKPSKDLWLLVGVAALVLGSITITALSVENPVNPARSWTTSGPARTPAPAPRLGAEAYLSDARYPCKQALERIARYQIRFANYDSPMPAGSRMNAGKPQFFGEDMEAQNGFGAWQKMSYVCTYDPVEKTAIAIARRRG